MGKRLAIVIDDLIYIAPVVRAEVRGGQAKIARKCGRENCRCADTPSARHTAHLLTSKVRGKTKSVYVPVELVEEVDSWVRERKKIKRLLKEIDELGEKLIRLHAPAARARSRNKSRLKPTPSNTSRSF
ncbi:MAG: DUF6788 family protein [Lentisphaeria bacterium]|nr:DUF6788 family protein [Lentisphaeria bacterium]